MLDRHPYYVADFVARALSNIRAALDGKDRAERIDVLDASIAKWRKRDRALAKRASGSLAYEPPDGGADAWQIARIITHLESALDDERRA